MLDEGELSPSVSSSIFASITIQYQLSVLLIQPPRALVDHQLELLSVSQLVSPSLALEQRMMDPLCSQLRDNLYMPSSQHVALSTTMDHGGQLERWIHLGL